MRQVLLTGKAKGAFLHEREEAGGQVQGGVSSGKEGVGDARQDVRGQLNNNEKPAKEEKAGSAPWEGRPAQQQQLLGPGAAVRRIQLHCSDSD